MNKNERKELRKVKSLLSKMARIAVNDRAPHRMANLKTGISQTYRICFSILHKYPPDE